MVSYRELYQAFADTKSEDELGCTLGRVLQSYGFAHFAYLGFNPPNSKARVYFKSDYPECWISRYIAKKYVFSDPVIQESRTQRLPYAWGEPAGEEILTRKQTRIMRECLDHGIRNGIGVPVHAPHGEFAVMTAIYDGPPKDMSKVLLESHPELYLAGVYFHSAIWQNYLSADETQSATLTAREVDVLSWASRGKTNWEVARILGISENAVKFHIRNSCKSLGTCSKLHTVTKAICLGLIRP